MDTGQVQGVVSHVLCAILDVTWSINKSHHPVTSGVATAHVVLR